MFRTVFLLKRGAFLSREEFRDRWLHQHLPLVEQLPGIIEIVKNGVEEVGGPGAEFDALTEIVWESETAFRSALVSPVGRRCVEDVVAFTSSHDYVVVARC